MSGPHRILAYREPVDMRKSFDGLIGLVASRLEEAPVSGTLFVYFNREGKSLKALTYVAFTSSMSPTPVSRRA